MAAGASTNGAGTSAGAKAAADTNGSVSSSSTKRPTPGISPFHTSSQFKHWRYSRAGLAALRAELNEKSKEVTARNVAAEKAAQESLGHKPTAPPPSYPSVEDELLLVRFYCSHTSTICRQGFGLPEVVEATAISYIKRFYLKNSVMEWHPKAIMPTCLFLAAKTTNHPVPIDVFVSKLQGFKANDVLDLEFLVAQSLAFEFWVHGADKPLRGWNLELQTTPPSSSLAPPAPPERAQRALAKALETLSTSRLTDAEFLYSPAQIALACWRASDRDLVDAYLASKYAGTADENGAAGDDTADADGADGAENGADAPTLPFGIPRAELVRITDEIEGMTRAAEGKHDLKKVKEIDKRLKSCTNPEKVPGTALYIKRKTEQETKAAEEKAEKVAKAARAREADEMVFGAPLGGGAKPSGAESDDPFGAPLGAKKDDA